MEYPIKTLSQLRLVLQGFRKAAGLTQAAMASQLGITQQSYAQIEANPAVSSMERLYKILRILNVELILAYEPNQKIDQGTFSTPRLEEMNENIEKTLEVEPETVKFSRTTAKKSTSRKAPKRVMPPSAKKESW
ncbi:helix-turn-helix transcriptional regulator [Solimicrobium silvestre]|uniref:HTH cro/C1-type domain-containing protein n=1 Tax=Solimicrobium silvestre TaxID=2099400 RepID=A0A2S9H349_9BURK|nr:helix-turn-helix transcriptional regulator [Solimicrobium silvestre]PRC94401.1 hypothetical protein S2091_1022 [Solimicrobium silvestre]